MKILYLDQNKWIDLSRAYYGLDMGKKYIKDLKIIQDKIKESEMLVPLSFLNLLEISKARGFQRRKKLASFMVEISKGYFILPFFSVRTIELQQALKRLFNIKTNLNIKEEVISRGIPWALGSELEISGLPDETADILKTLLNTKNTMIQMISESYSPEFSDELYKQDNFGIKLIEKHRSERFELLSKGKRRMLEIIYTFKDLLSETLVKELEYLNINISAFQDRISKLSDWEKFIFDMPTMDVWINLIFQRNEQRDRKIHRNDVSDIGFLTMAIPYCDCVIIEKFWASKIKQVGLDKKYNCIVSNNISDVKLLFDKNTN